MLNGDVLDGGVRAASPGTGSDDLGASRARRDGVSERLVAHDQGERRA